MDKYKRWLNGAAMAEKIRPLSSLMTRKVPWVLLPLMLFLLGMVISYRYSHAQHSFQLELLREHVVADLDKIRGDLSRELYAGIQITQGLVSLVAVEGGISQDRFYALANDLIRYNPLIRNVALAPNNVVRYVYPLQENEKAIGLDYLQTPSQREAVLRAIAMERMVVAGPIDLVQGGQGIISRTPIFWAGPHGRDSEKKYWGISSTVLDFQKLIETAGLKANQSKLRLALRGKDGTGSQGAIFWGDSSVFSSDPVVMDVPLPSGSWQLAALPMQGWPLFNPLLSWVFHAGGMLTVTLSLLMFQLLRIYQARALEVRERKNAETGLYQANRALRLFSLCNSIVVQASDEKALLADICRIAVDSAGYPMAWVGRAEQDDARTVRPITFAGPGEGFLDRIHVSWADNEYGQGTAGTAIRTRTASIGRDLPNNPTFSTWRPVLQTRNYASAIAVPLIVAGEVFGVLVIYASEAYAFDTTEVSLLQDLGKNISHGMMALRLQKERTEAMAALEHTRNELEVRVQRRTHQLQLAKEAAEAADKIKSAFLATMSHELRTPLNSIIGFTGIMLQGLAGPLNPEQTKQLNMANNSAHHLLALINDVLDISKIEAGQLQVLCRPFALHDSVEKVVQSIRSLAEKKGLELQVDIDPVGIIAFADPRRVEQVLMNLLSNAIKFTEQGVIRLKRHVRGSDIEIAVSDTGIGISPQDQILLFQPFRQLETGLTRKHEGTGLGLSICKRLLELMRGTIRVQSQPGVGSTFTFSIPIQEPEHE